MITNHLTMQLSKDTQGWDFFKRIVTLPEMKDSRIVRGETLVVTWNNLIKKLLVKSQVSNGCQEPTVTQDSLECVNLLSE